MTRILLVADNHGDFEIIEKIFKKANFDFSIHLGDSLQSEKYIKNKFDKYASGNNEHFKIMEDNFLIENINISILHGHSRGIGMFNIHDGALNIANSNNSSIILFGHTHYPFYEVIDDIAIINPGALRGPRNGSKKSYAILTLNEGQIIDLEFKII